MFICPDYNYEINKFSNDGGATPNGEFILQVQGVDLDTVETQANGNIILTEGSIGHYLVTVIPLEGGATVPTIEGLGTGTTLLITGLAAADYRVTIIPNVDAFKNVCRKEFIVTVDGGGIFQDAQILMLLIIIQLLLLMMVLVVTLVDVLILMQEIMIQLHVKTMVVV